MTNEDYLSIYDLTVESTEEEIREAIANILGIQHVERAIKSSERIMEVTDKTEFQAAAKFDTKQWLLNQEDVLEAVEIDSSAPEAILMH